MRKDGSRFLASVTFTALHDPAGNLLGFSEFSHDLSESKESEAKYRGLLEAAPDAMVVVDEAGEIVLLNVQAEKQFGYRRDELVGQKVNNIIPEGLCRTADCRRYPNRGGSAGTADRHGDRALWAAEGWTANFPSRSCSARWKAPKESWSRRPSAISPSAKRSEENLLQDGGGTEAIK